MTDYYLITVYDNGDVTGEQLDPLRAEELPGVPYSDRIANDNQGDSNTAKADAGCDVLMAIMPDEDDEDGVVA